MLIFQLLNNFTWTHIPLQGGHNLRPVIHGKEEINGCIFHYSLT